MEQLRFIGVAGVIIAVVLYLQWRSRAAASKFRNDIVDDTLWRKKIYEEERPLNDEAKAALKDIAVQLNRIATALEEQNK